MKPDSHFYQETKCKLIAMKNFALQEDPEFLKKRQNSNESMKQFSN